MEFFILFCFPTVLFDWFQDGAEVLLVSPSVVSLMRTQKPQGSSGPREALGDSERPRDALGWCLFSMDGF